MNILVTGIAGFIGSHLGERLLAEGHRVVGVDNFDPFYDRSIKEDNLRIFSAHENAVFIEGDLSDRTTVDRLFKEASVDMVIHLAAKAGVLPSLNDPQGYIRANITATANILEAMKSAGCTKLAFASSSSVYGNNKVIPFSEEASVNAPISPYAFTKRSCELMNYTYHHLYGLDVLNLRFFIVYGPRQRPDLAIHKFTTKIAKGESISMYGDGSTARDYTFVSDTVQGILGAVAYLEKHTGVYEIINLGNNRPVKLKDLIAILYRLTGKSPNVEQLPMQPGDVDITYASIEKAKRLLDYQPSTTIEEGLQQFMDWHQF